MEDLLHRSEDLSLGSQNAWKAGHDSNTFASLANPVVRWYSPWTFPGQLAWYIENSRRTWLKVEGKE